MRVFYIFSRGVGHRCKVDDEDFEKVHTRTWYIVQGYAYTGHGPLKTSMQHFILGFEPGSRRIIRRKNGNKLDNRKENFIGGGIQKKAPWAYTDQQRSEALLRREIKRAQAEYKELHPEEYGEVDYDLRGTRRPDMHKIARHDEEWHKRLDASLAAIYARKGKKW